MSRKKTPRALPRNKPIARRSFLKGLLAGGAAVTLPLPRLGKDLSFSGTAYADGSALPGKFGVWFFGNGMDPATWHPAGGGGVGAGWALTEQLAPLQAYKSHLTVLSKLECRSGGAHVGGSAGATTAAPPGEQGGALLPSIDQIIAKQIGGDTPYRSLEVGLSRATPAGPQPCLHTVSHSGPGAPNYPDYDPHRLFARLFGASSSAPELRIARRSVLDAVLSDLNSLKAKVGREDKARLEAHTEGVRALERRLVDMPRSCGLIEAPGDAVQMDTREEAPAALNDAMGQMIAMALACDLTHVFSYQFTLPAGHVYYRNLGPDFERSFHEDIVHLVDTIPDGYGKVRRGVQYAMECMANHLGHLQRTPTATGGNLLDELLMLATSDVSYGWTHEMQDYPVLLLGKAKGKIKGDQHWVAGGAQDNYSRVLLTAAQTMGVNISEIGLAECKTSDPINDIRA